MAYNLDLAKRIRDHIGPTQGITEKKMFGGVAFLLHGRMALGVHRNDLIVRVGEADYQEALSHPGARPFDLTGKPMVGWVAVDAEGYQRESYFEMWVLKGVSFASSLPMKEPK
jgi:TfoX/Sxy family transcriptional regulator of competence genes